MVLIRQRQLQNTCFLFAVYLKFRCAGWYFCIIRLASVISLIFFVPIPQFDCHFNSIWIRAERNIQQHSRMQRIVYAWNNISVLCRWCDFLSLSNEITAAARLECDKPGRRDFITDMNRHGIQETCRTVHGFNKQPYFRAVCAEFLIRGCYDKFFPIR